MSFEHDLLFHAMGSDVRLMVGAPLMRQAPTPGEAAERERRYVQDFAVRLSRFRQDSELCALNADPREAVSVSPLLAAAVQAGLWAAQRSGGLVDPTLGDAIAQVGYSRSLDGETPPSLEEALAAAPARRPARPRPDRRWRQVTVTERIVRRPPRLAIDTGGVGKGLCADAVAHRLSGYSRCVVDCGGDLAIGGVGAQLQPYEVEVEHPLTGETVRTIRVSAGGVATSGLNVRLWRTAEGGFAHHLLDPESGAPAWTGLIGVTALGGSALEAETLSKTALLLGPLGARGVLAEHGGLIVYDSGDVEEIGALDRVHGARALLGDAA